MPRAPLVRLALALLLAPACAGDIPTSPGEEDALAGGAQPTVSQESGAIVFRNAQGRYWIATSCTTEPDGNQIGPGYIYQATAFTAAGEIVKTRDRLVRDYPPCSSCPCSNAPAATTSESWHGDPRTGGWGKFGIHLTRDRYLGDPYQWDDYRVLSTATCRYVPAVVDLNDPPRAGVSSARVTEGPSCSGSECSLGVTVTLGDEYVDPILEVTYRYRVGASYVRLWTTVREVESGASDGWVKEPEFAVSDGGSASPFSRLVYEDTGGPTCTDGPSPGTGRQAMVGGDNWDPRCGTRQCGNPTRRTAVFTDASGTCADGCLDVTAKAHTNGIPGGGTQLDWGGAGAGIDEWAARVKDGRRGPPLDGGSWPSYCAAQRRFEAVRWSRNRSPEGADFTAALFAGWQGGSGGSDCRNRFYHFASGASWSNYFQFVQHATGAPACGALAPGASLERGQKLTSCDGRFELIMQDDGNLVLYQAGTALWSSATYGTDGRRAVMQLDGNLVVQDSTGRGRWSSGTYGHPGAFAIVQDDGNFVVYQADDALWASDTCCR